MAMSVWWRLLFVVLVLGSSLFPSPPAPAADWADVTDQRLMDPDKEPQNWLTYYRSYSGWRFSPLAQITPQNVKRLTPKWMLSSARPATSRPRRWSTTAS